MHAPASTYLPRYYVLECTRTGRPCMSIMCVCVFAISPGLGEISSMDWNYDQVLQKTSSLCIIFSIDHYYLMDTGSPHTKSKYFQTKH